MFTLFGPPLLKICSGLIAVSRSYLKAASITFLVFRSRGHLSNFAVFCLALQKIKHKRAAITNVKAEGEQKFYHLNVLTVTLKTDKGREKQVPRVFFVHTLKKNYFRL